ncbi:ABC transporter ATP-binding protein [Frigidibacter sp. ROC022]|uniref:ABC transporter ATP-binding protein n=1 Tax=Frigidibacter sp. ROC022 TaxID=2971796 RepID=UPI00215B5499|nr:ABC transporter ATP-binding protein [Frigidibacter sp. ROC022]MCR8725016.1 ABC transporter ATP-binding protein [Frigidibacter sp. ROC022]
MLEIADIAAGYGPVRVLEGLSLKVPAGQVTCVMGRNGAGKSTMLKAVMGLVRVEAGTVALEGQRIERLEAHRVPGLGIGYVPQGRRLFGDMTVAENIAIGLRTRGRGAATRERVLDLFPRLRERLGQLSRTLSGGEQQMLAVARALCLEPKLLMLDEPTEGLQPSMIALIREVVLRLRDEGVAVLLVEQRVDAVLAMADRVAFMTGGHVAEVVPAPGLTPEAPQFVRYVGV